MCSFKTSLFLKIFSQKMHTRSFRRLSSKSRRSLEAKPNTYLKLNTVFNQLRHISLPDKHQVVWLADAKVVVEGHVVKKIFG